MTALDDHSFWDMKVLLIAKSKDLNSKRLDIYKTMIRDTSKSRNCELSSVAILMCSLVLLLMAPKGKSMIMYNGNQTW